MFDFMAKFKSLFKRKTQDKHEPVAPPQGTGDAKIRPKEDAPEPLQVKDAPGAFGVNPNPRNVWRSVRCGKV